MNGRPTCPICTNDRVQDWFEDIWPDQFRKRAFSCRNCRFGFVDPLPSQENLDRIYSAASYFRNPEWKGLGYDYYEMDAYWRQAAALLNLFGARGKPAKDASPANRTPSRAGKLLDIGCANGFFLERVKAGGWEGFGLELNSAAAREARAKGFTVYEGHLEKWGWELPESAFDAVTMLEILEHVLDFRQALGFARRLLRDGGVLILSTPNRFGLPQFFVPGFFRKKAREHLWYFSRRSLALLLEQSHFQILKLQSVSLIEPTLLAAARKAPSTDSDFGNFPASHGPKPVAERHRPGGGSLRARQ